MAKKLSPGSSARLEALFIAPETMDTICTHVAQGGSLIDLCEVWDVVYGRVTNWIKNDPLRTELYKESLADRDEWVKEAILSQLREIANADVRQIFEEDGSLKPISEWDKDVAKAVSGVDVFHEKDGSGVTKKIKMNDKLKAIELIGKTMAMFIDRTHHTGELTLAELVAMSNKPKEAK